MNQTDIHKDLVLQCQEGDRQAQYQLYTLYSKAMFNVCLRMLKQRDEAEDVLQEAFIKAFNNLQSFRFASTFGAWLKRIVVNTAINHMRRKEPATDSLDEWEQEAREGLFEQTDTLHEENLQLEVEAVKRAINMLPDGFRVVFTLYAMEGYDHREISDILGVTESTSKSQYNRARKKLRELLENELCR